VAGCGNVALGEARSVGGGQEVSQSLPMGGNYFLFTAATLTGSISESSRIALCHLI